MEVNSGNSGAADQVELIPVGTGPQAPEAPGPGPIEWFRANLVYFLILGVMVVMIYTNFGIPGLVKAGMVGLGLGLVLGFVFGLRLRNVTRCWPSKSNHWHCAGFRVGVSRLFSLLDVFRPNCL